MTTSELILAGLKWLGGLVFAVVAITPGYLAFRSSKRADERSAKAEEAAAAAKVQAAEEADEAQRKADEIASKKVDRSDLEAANAEWRRLFAQVKEELAAERSARQRAERNAADLAEERRSEVAGRNAAERVAVAARQEVAELKSRVAHLETDLREARAEIARLTPA